MHGRLVDRHGQLSALAAMITFHGSTDAGKRRATNEDAIWTGEDHLFLVCDGMGGHKAGEVASQLAVHTITRFVERSSDEAEITWPYGFDIAATLEGNRLRTAIKLANRAVHRKAESSEEYEGMGTTVVAVLLSRGKPHMTYAGVGDSRVYLLRGDEIRQLTKDDSWASLGGDGGIVDDKTAAAMQHVLTKALGATEDVQFEVTSQELQPGDIVLLCSDGLTNMASDERIREIVQANQADPRAACNALVAAANLAGGRDNISAVVVRYSG
ncbi:MAG TPA: protein phosphatase 2C domain-containing protein [Candidatus Binatia bacterium]|nr:protein phosphatase 2C domain-containing protein [Candidatus Binatia bacterium]